MQQQCSKQGIMAIWVMLVVVSVVVSGPAASQATAPCPCQEALQMAPHADPAAHPVSLGTRAVQDLEQMYCAQTCLLQETTFERMQPYEEARQRAATALQETVSHLEMADFQHLLTAEAATHLKTFKRAFRAFQHRSSDVASKALLAKSPTEIAAARELAAGPDPGAFDQADTALQQLVARLGDAEPSAEAVKAELGFPPVGTKWVRKIVVHGKDIIITRTYTVLEESTHGGKPVHRISDGAKISLFDKATRNWTARVRSGEELNSASPYVPAYAFPLWVGKSWKTTYAYNDREREATFENIVWRGRVTAYEDVTVPAGTFETFKVEGTDGGVKLVLWYSPKLNIAVKSSFERLPGHYIGPGTFTSELTEYPAK